MPAGISSSSEPGNGWHYWLKKLIAKILQLTIDLQELAARIGLLADPAENDVAEAYDRVSQLLSLIVQEVMPHRRELSQLGSLPDLDEALKGLGLSGQSAFIAIDVYTKTLKNEQRQRASERRSNRRYAADQLHLQQLRCDAAERANELITASKDFVNFLS
jgi:hypothetical protein